MKIEIESRESIQRRAMEPFPARTALISIADTDNCAVRLKHNPDYRLRLKFNDVSVDHLEDMLERKPTEAEVRALAREHHMFSNADAAEVAAFIKSILGEAETLICQCEYGQSRSAGIAAAVKQFLNGNGTEIFEDERYCPNKRVYEKVMEALNHQFIRGKGAGGVAEKFERFRYECEERQFSCHIFYKDNTLEIIENNLDRLISINPADVVYFEGAWDLYKIRRHRRATKSTSDHSWEHGSTQSLTDVCVFGIGMLHRLPELGINISVVGSLIPQLYKKYEQQEKARGCELEFKRYWDEAIKSWKAHHRLMKAAQENQNVAVISSFQRCGEKEEDASQLPMDLRRLGYGFNFAKWYVEPYGGGCERIAWCVSSHNVVCPEDISYEAFEKSILALAKTHKQQTALIWSAEKQISSLFGTVDSSCDAFELWKTCKTFTHNVIKESIFSLIARKESQSFPADFTWADYGVSADYTVTIEWTAERKCLSDGGS